MNEKHLVTSIKSAWFAPTFIPTARHTWPGWDRPSWKEQV
jgi:hypothetical protein